MVKALRAAAAHPLFGFLGLWWLSALAIEAATGKGRFLLPRRIWSGPPLPRTRILSQGLPRDPDHGRRSGERHALGLWLTVLLALSRGLRFWLLPLLVISQAIPVFALAPLLVQWLGWGLAPKVAMTTLILFFPVTMAFWGALRAVDRDIIDAARVFGANRWQLLRTTYLPLALPGGLNGLKSAAAIAPIGAFIGELVGGQQVGGAYGLGYIILRELKINARTDSMMVAVVFMIILALGLYALVLLSPPGIGWSVTDLKPLSPTHEALLTLPQPMTGLARLLSLLRTTSTASANGYDPSTGSSTPTTGRCSSPRNWGCSAQVLRSN